MLIVAMLGCGGIFLMPDGPGPLREVGRSRTTGDRIEAGGKSRRERPAPPKVGITPAEARERLVVARGIEDIRSRAAASREVIAALCAAGHAEEAWAFIGTEPGQVRSHQLEVFFHHAKLADQALYEKLLALSPQEMSAGMRGLCQRHRPEELAAYLTSPGFKDFFVRLEAAGFTKNGLATTLSPLLQLHVHDAATGDVAGQRTRMEAVADLYGKGLLTPEVMVAVLKNGNLMNIAARVDAMQRIPDLGDGRNALQTYRRSLMSAWVKRDPEAALAAARAGPQPLMDLSNTFSSWAKVDGAAAADWYAANAGSLAWEHRDAAAMGGFAVSVDLGDYDAAREWILQISKSERRDYLSKYLATREGGK